jgi:hypothetical protein
LKSVLIGDFLGRHRSGGSKFEANQGPKKKKKKVRPYLQKNGLGKMAQVKECPWQVQDPEFKFPDHHQKKYHRDE